MLYLWIKVGNKETAICTLSLPTDGAVREKEDSCTVLNYVPSLILFVSDNQTTSTFSHRFDHAAV